MDALDALVMKDLVVCTGCRMHLQDSQAEHSHYGALNAPVELDVPEEEDGEGSKDPVC